MIDFYFVHTPNGQKMWLFLAETNRLHKEVLVRLSTGYQYRSEFRAISPSGKIPAIVDRTPKDDGPPVQVFESGAILLYLAEETGRFVSSDPRIQMTTLTGLFWKMAGLGPTAGQAEYYLAFASAPVSAAIERYTREPASFYGVIDKHLRTIDFIAGDYSIADMAIYPWIVPYAAYGQTHEGFSELRRWFEAISDRSATKMAYGGVTDVYAGNALRTEGRTALFGGPV